MQVTFNIYNGLVYSQAAQVLNLSTTSIEKKIREIETLTYNIATDSNIQENANMMMHASSDYNRSEHLSKLLEQLVTYSFQDNNIQSVSFVDTQNRQYNRGASPFGIDEKVKNLVIEKAVAAEGKSVILKPPDDENCIMIARIIRKIHALSLEYMGTVIIRYDIGDIANEYLSSSKDNEPILAIISEEGLIFSSKELSDNEIDMMTFKSDSGYEIKKINGEKLFLAHNVSDYTGWTYVSIIPYDKIFKSLIFMRTIVLLVYFLIFLLTIIAGRKLAWNLTRPLEILTQEIKQIESGNFKIPDNAFTEPERHDEIGQLHRDFEIMIRKIDALIEENYIKQIVLKDAQLRALQAQINPHFLYNTLETINWMAKVNHQEDISRMVEALGTLLRGAISKESVIRLEEEIRLLESYIVIQKFRYDKKLDFQLYVPDTLKDLKIPKLTLQPIVENSINYGLEKMLGTCCIRVSFVQMPDFLDITIEDNGPGIDPETVKKMNEGQIKPNGFGIGLKNIDDRIKLLFGNRYGVHISSEVGRGTKVRVTIPYTRGDVDVQGAAG